MVQRTPCTAETCEGAVCHKACRWQARYLDEVPKERLEKAKVYCGEFGEPFCRAEPSAVMGWPVNVLLEYERCREATIGAYDAEFLDANHPGWTCAHVDFTVAKDSQHMALVRTKAHYACL